MSQSVTQLRIGSRASPLAIRQSHILSERLRTLYPDVQIEYVNLRTTGDILMAPRLSAVGGKGLFTKELEEALLANHIDVAVHSLKDMATRLPEGLVIGAVLEREDPRDAFIARDSISFTRLEKQTIVGTSSLRREAFTRYWHPEVQIVPFRGNVQTRLQKLADQEADCTFLALAGLKRMGLEAQATEILEPAQMLPAVAQGCLAVEVRARDQRILEFLAPIHHAQTGFAVHAERAFLRALDGSCRTPIAALATVRDARLHLQGALIRPDGQELIQESIEGSVDDHIELGVTIATRIQTNLGSRLARDFQMELNPTVLILRHASGAARSASLWADWDRTYVIHSLFQVHKLSRPCYEAHKESVFIITSGSVVEVCDEHDFQQLKQARTILCVGAETAQIAKEQGLISNVVVTGDNSAQMIAYIQKHFGAPQQFYHLRGKVHYFDYERLHQAGFVVDAVDMYELIVDHEQVGQVQALITSEVPLWIPLYSTQMAEVLIPILNQVSLRNITFLCLSPRIYDFLRLHLCHKFMCLFTIGRWDDIYYIGERRE